MGPPALGRKGLDVTILEELVDEARKATGVDPLTDSTNVGVQARAAIVLTGRMVGLPVSYFLEAIPNAKYFIGSKYEPPEVVRLLIRRLYDRMVTEEKA